MTQHLKHIPLVAHGLVVFAVLLHGCSCLQPSLPAAGGRCVPSYIPISGEDIHLSYSGFLIGCRHDLESLDDQSLEQLHVAINSYLYENDLDFIRKVLNDSYRNELPDRLNSALGRVVVTDIILGASIHELMPY